MTRILFIGDVVGGLGRRTLLKLLPELQRAHDPNFVVVNAENVAGGLGITPKIADELFAAGVDVITLGNHAYHRREIYPYLDSGKPIVRPANYLATQPGKGSVVVEKDGVKLAVVNLSGNVFLRAGRVALLEIDTVLASLPADVDH
ncbi:MAG TPA: YmdB family metallophosphoesterase, partial [Baekduia sp.]|nr:YmdB family metallophosphoesterase [Baekduia sp.]